MNRMAQLVKAVSPEKQIGDVNKSNNVDAKRQTMTDSDSICLSVDNVHSIENLKVFMSFLCDKQATDLVTAIRSSTELFNYCIPAREAVLLFYGDLFMEYSTYYWINKKRSLIPVPNSNNTVAEEQQTKSKIEYVGELTRRFFEMEKLKLADAQEDQATSEVDEPSTSKMDHRPVRVMLIKTLSTSSHLSGPDSPPATGSHTSPTSSPNKISVPPREIPTSRRTSSCHSNENNMDQTPMSPSAQDNELNTVDDDMQCETSEIGLVDIFSELENQIPLIRSTITNLISKYGLMEHDNSESNNHQQASWPERQKERFRNLIISWASDILIHLNAKHSETSATLATDLTKCNSKMLLAKQIELWNDNPASKLLLDIILDSRHDVCQLFERLSVTGHNCDWLLAHFLLEMSKQSNHGKNFTMCMEYIIGRSCDINSLTYILAYMSDNNPKAMTNFPKSNIPFLISLCQTSASLLNVLALEIPDEINPEFLNNLAKEVFRKVPNQNHSTCIEGLTHCIVAAPNSYKLFLLALDVMQNEGVNSEVKSATQVIIDSILLRMQQRVMNSNQNSNVVMSNPQVRILDGLLNLINSDPSKLIEKTVRSRFAQRKARSIFNLMSLLYGHGFASTVIAHHLNLPEKYSWLLLKPLLDRLMKNFADDGSTLVSQTLASNMNLRTQTFWKNLYNLTLAMPDIKLNLDLLSQLIADKLCAATLDIDSIAQLIKLCCSSLERVDHSRIRIGTRHKLCMSLATSFFLLLELNGDNFPEILSYTRVTLTCMSLLRRSQVASHILCRALLERSLAYGHLFNIDFDPDLLGVHQESNDTLQDDIKLSKENMKVSLGQMFRRLPNHRASVQVKKIKVADERQSIDRQSINSYLLIEAFKSSINDLSAFADLFVEFFCPVMFEKNLWPPDENLRVINEKNLGILRKFDQVPPFWDLFELIGQAKCLKSCLVLVKALLAAHLAMWASATAKSCPDKMITTTRLIPPLAESGLIPRAFGLAVEVIPHLTPNQVFAVLCDIWSFLKDTVHEENVLQDDVKMYLTRLRTFMCHHMPGSTYVKIFKELYKPAPKTIPT